MTSSGMSRRLVLGAAGALAAPRVQAQSVEWPTGPIRFIGIFPPGGGLRAGPTCCRGRLRPMTSMPLSTSR